ncbi:MAG TPA: ADOP family duplicated permease [Thermoanaerobaculia bacterium]|nr:ADOP family duplicated permease [Thermoanaerobaculia bacterium]
MRETRGPGEAPDALERELDDELEFHFARTIEDLVAAGLAPEAAAAEARRRFGDVARHRRALRAIGRERIAARRREVEVSAVVDVLRHGLREARRSPSSSLGVILTLALGIGANAVTFSLVDRLLLRGPVGVEDVSAVRRVYVDREVLGARQIDDHLAYQDFLDFQGAEPFAAVAAEASTTVLYGHGEEATTLRAALVTHEMFPLLGVDPALGRFYGPDEDRPGGPWVAVLGHSFWRRELGGDPQVLGRSLELGEGRYTVVGVAPPGFTGASVARVDIFLPLRSAVHEVVSGDWETSRSFYWLRSVVRLAPGVEVAAAETAATTIHRRGRSESKEYDRQARVVLPSLVRATGPGVSGEVQVAGLLALVSILVLVIATVNVANLLLARALRRGRELAVRLALGVGRRRLIAEQVVEGALLGLAGGLLALGVALWGGGLVRSVLVPWVAWEDAALWPRMVGFVALVSLASGALAAVVPAALQSRPDLSRWLHAGSHRIAGGRSRLRVSLQVAQAALSVVLLVGALLFVRSLGQAQAIDVGIEPRGLLVASLERFALRQDRETEEAERFAADLVERLSALAGVESGASSVGSGPFGGAWAVGLRAPGVEQPPRLRSGGPYVHGVTPGYLEAVGTALLRGRGIEPHDRFGAPRVAVVNETMAATYWPGEDPLGKCLLVAYEEKDPEPPCSEVVGVVENARRFSIDEGESALYYVPRAQRQFTTGGTVGTFYLRARDPRERATAELAQAVRREIFAFAPDSRHVSVRRMEDVLAPQYRAWRLGATLFTVFGVLALVVAAIGLYSLLSFEIAGRRHEIGVRAALGASRRRLVRQVVRSSLVLVGAGSLLGAGIALLAARSIRSLLYGVEPADPASYVVVVLAMLLVAAAASWGPARRASRVPPTEALRAE